MNKYLKRLIKEWETHGKVIIGVDFDSTLSPYHTIDNPTDINKVIATLLMAQRVGCYIIIHTSCNPTRHDEIYSYCSQLGIKVDDINRTPIDLPYGKDGSKPYCNIYLDDRAGLVEATGILENACMHMIGKINTEGTLRQQF